MTEEGAIQARILKDLGDDPRWRVWRQSSGVGRALKNDAVVRFGVPGCADISGILFPSGRRLEIEVKTDTGRQSKDQKSWQAMIARYGGVYIVARSAEDARAQLERACVQGV